MPIQKTITLYEYDELGTVAQGKARDWYRSMVDATDMEPTIEDFETIARLLGVTLKRTPDGEALIAWGLHVQGSGASFEGSWAHADADFAKLREYAPEDQELHSIATELELCAGCTATLTRRSHHYPHSYTIEIEAFNADEERSDRAEDVIAPALRGLMNWLYRALDREWDYQTSDEAIEENIRANEYHFTETGKRCNP